MLPVIWKREAHERQTPQQDVARCVLLLSAGGGRARLGMRASGTAGTPGPASCLSGVDTGLNQPSGLPSAGGRPPRGSGPGPFRVAALSCPSGGGTSPGAAGLRSGLSPSWLPLCARYGCPPVRLLAGGRTPPLPGRPPSRYRGGRSGRVPTGGGSVDPQALPDSRERPIQLCSAACAAPPARF